MTLALATAAAAGAALAWLATLWWTASGRKRDREASLTPAR